MTCVYENCRKKMRNVLFSRLHTTQMTQCLSGPVPLEDLLEQIKYQWVERCTFTRSSKPFSVQGSSIPPVIATKLRGEVILNTEMQKKSLLKKGKTAVEGNKSILLYHNTYFY